MQLAPTNAVIYVGDAAFHVWLPPGAFPAQGCTHAAADVDVWMTENPPPRSFADPPRTELHFKCKCGHLLTSGEINRLGLRNRDLLPMLMRAAREMVRDAIDPEE